MGNSQVPNRKRVFRSGSLYYVQGNLPIVQEPGFATEVYRPIANNSRNFPGQYESGDDVTQSFFGSSSISSLDVKLRCSYRRLGGTYVEVEGFFSFRTRPDVFMSLKIEGNVKSDGIIPERFSVDGSKYIAIAESNVKSFTLSTRGYIVDSEADSHVASWFIEMRTRGITTLSFKSDIEIIGNSRYRAPSLPNNNLLVQRYSCPRISIFANTDSYYGKNLGQCVLRVLGEKCYSRYALGFETYIVSYPGASCILSSKILAIARTTRYKAIDLQGWIVLRGLLRWFLWKLISGKFWLGVLQRKYDGLFYTLLSTSPYSCFIEAFETEPLSLVEDYFVKTLST